MSTPRPPTDDKLLDLLYGEVLPEDAEALQALVNTDPVLRERLEAWTSVRQAMASLPEPEPDPQVHYNILRAARQQAAPAEAPRGFFAWLSSLAVNPAFAGLGLMVLAGGALFYFSKGYQDSDAPVAAAPTALEKVLEAPEGGEQAPAFEGTIAPATTATVLDQEDPRDPGIMGGAAKPPVKALEASVAEKALPDDGKALALEQAAEGEAAKAEASPEDAEGLGWQTGKKGTKAGDTLDGLARDERAQGGDAAEAAPAREPKRKRAPAKTAARPAPRAADKKSADRAAFDLEKKEDAFAPPPPVAVDAPPPAVAVEAEPFPAEAPGRGAGRAEESARNTRGLAKDLAVATGSPEPPVADADDGEDGAPEAVRGPAPAEEVADALLADPVPSADDAAGAERFADVPTDAPAAAPVPQGVVAQGAGGMAPPRPEPETRRPAAVAARETDTAVVAEPAARRAADAEDGATPAALRQARAARQRGDHAAAVEAYQRYFSSNRGHDQFAISMIEAARSYEVLGDTGRALQLYRLAAASDDPTVRALARQRIAALEAVRQKPKAARADRPAAVDELEEAPAAPAEPNAEPDAPKE